MPEPMVPAPTTPTVSISAIGSASVFATGESSRPEGEAERTGGTKDGPAAVNQPAAGPGLGRSAGSVAVRRGRSHAQPLVEREQQHAAGLEGGLRMADKQVDRHDAQAHDAACERAAGTAQQGARGGACAHAPADLNGVAPGAGA